MNKKDINKYIRNNQKLSREELAIKCGITKNAVEKREYAMNIKRDFTGMQVAPEEAIKELRAKEYKTTAAKQYKSLLNKYDAINKQLVASMELKKAVSTHTVKATRGVNSEATAVCLLSDWHVEEEIRPATVMGMNEYNLDIAKARADMCFVNIAKLVKKEQQAIQIKELVVGLLGDFITGRLHEENMENAQLPPMQATIFAQELIESGINFLLNNTKLNMTFVCRAGNHSRITKKIHFSTELGNSLEYMMYHNLKLRFADEKRIKFVIPESYHAYIDIYGFTMRMHHGHAVRFAGGVGGLTIPLNKAIHQWNLTRPATFDAIGHWHQYLPMPRAVVNGSLIGFSAYALANKFEFEPPTQAFFLVDKKRGKTVNIPILFDV